MRCRLGGKSEWIAGVGRESINRKGDTTPSPEDGYWTVDLGEKPKKVGVFVDYEEGLVSFYDVEARSHIYSFTGCTFTEKLYPYFSSYMSLFHSTWLIITPITH